jgi:hypothetical protein
MGFLINPFIYAVAPGGCSGNLISLSNIQGYYKFEGNTIDSTLNGNDATATNLTYTSAGWFQSGGTFDGSATLVNMPAKNYSIATGYTITAWIKTNTSRVAPMQILCKDKVNYGGANRRDFQFRVDGTGDGVGKLRFVRFSNNTTVVTNFASTGTVNSGNWVHVAAVFDNAVGSKIYINGVQDGSDAVTTNNQNSTDSNIRIGSIEEGATSGIANVFSGNTDEVSFWNRPLTASEIQTLAESTCPLNTPANIISVSNLVAYYKLNGDSASSSLNALTLTNYNNLVVYTSGIAKFSQSGVFLTGTTDPTSSRRALTISSTSSFPNTNSTSALATYMGWFNFDNLPSTSESYLWSLARTGQRNVTCTYQSSNNLRIQIFDGSSGYQTDYSWTPSTDTWYHIAVTQNAGLFTIYIDGASAHTYTNTNNGNGGGNIFRLGGHEGFNLSFLGHIDDFAVYSRVLSATEIQTVYNSTNPLIS